MPSIQAKSYSSCPATRVAFLGLGVMGFPMAGHLVEAGHQVTVYNRSAEKSKAWAEEFGGATAATAAEAAAKADMVFCCVGNDNDLRSVTTGPDGAFAAMAKGALFVDHTTASAEVARELNAKASALGLGFMDAPVSGGQAGAVSGQLTVMVGGAQLHFDAAKPVAMAYSKAFTRIGDSGSGQLAKMVNQICVAGLLQVVADGEPWPHHD
jgi:3-hydroxyisobutyrate dehydrogenase-like beta-hydroxyacid dehydrogenase